MTELGMKSICHRGTGHYFGAYGYHTADAGNNFVRKVSSISPRRRLRRGNLLLGVSSTRVYRVCIRDEDARARRSESAAVTFFRRQPERIRMVRQMLICTVIIRKGCEFYRRLRKVYYLGCLFTGKLRSILYRKSRPTI